MQIYKDGENAPLGFYRSFTFINPFASRWWFVSCAGALGGFHLGNDLCMICLEENISEE